MTPEIRRAEVEDFQDLAYLSSELGYGLTDVEIRLRLEDLAKRPEHAVFVAESPEGQVVGWVHVCLCRYLESDPFAEVVGLVVAQEHRSSGVGAALLTGAEEWAREQEMEAIRVRSNVVRERAHRFYLRQGFVQIKTQTVFSKLLL